MRTLLTSVMLTVLMTPACWSMTSDVAGAHADSWTLAADELRGELAKRYPRITRWTIVPQSGNPARDPVPKGLPQRIEVLRTGVRSSVRLTWPDERGGTHSRSFWFAVAGEEHALQMHRSVAKGVSLTSADAAMTLSNTFSLQCTPLTDPNELNGMRARRALHARSVACRESVEPRPAVARGEKISVRYVSARIELGATGIAQEDGEVGQQLRVLNPGSREAFRAVVVAPAEVLVRE